MSVIIGIGGATASGKSSLARRLVLACVERGWSALWVHGDEFQICTSLPSTAEIGSSFLSESAAERARALEQCRLRESPENVNWTVARQALSDARLRARVVVFDSWLLLASPSWFLKSFSLIYFLCGTEQAKLCRRRFLRREPTANSEPSVAFIRGFDETYKWYLHFHTALLAAVAVAGGPSPRQLVRVAVPADDDSDPLPVAVIHSDNAVADNVNKIIAEIPA